MTVKEFLFDAPLYERLNSPSHNSIIWWGKTFDGYNPIDKIDTTFSIGNSISGEKNSYNTINVNCKRTGTEFVFFIF